MRSDDFVKAPEELSAANSSSLVAERRNDSRSELDVHVAKDSHNSSRPPSTEPLSGQKDLCVRQESRMHGRPVWGVVCLKAVAFLRVSQMFLQHVEITGRIVPLMEGSEPN